MTLTLVIKICALLIVQLHTILKNKIYFSNLVNRKTDVTYIIKIDIEHHVAYVHKNGLEDPFFRRLKLIVWLILVRSQILS